MSAILPLVNQEHLPTELRDLLNSPDGPAFEQALDVMVRGALHTPAVSEWLIARTRQ